LVEDNQADCNGSDAREVDSKLELEEPGNIVENVSAPADSHDDSTEIIISKNKISLFFRAEHPNPIASPTLAA